MASSPRASAYLRAYALWEDVQGEDHARAAAALAGLRAEAEEQGWTDVAFVARAAQVAYAVVRPDGSAPDLDGLVASAEGAPAFVATALALGALDASLRGDTEGVLARAGQAVALLDDPGLPALDRCTAYVVAAAAYNSLSLWELVDELYDAAQALVPASVVPAQAAALAVNRVLVRTEWATSLLETGDEAGGELQLGRALAAAADSREVALPPLWRLDVQAVETAAALLLGPDEADAPRLLDLAAAQREALAAGGDLEVLPVLDACRALALLRHGREAEARAVVALLETDATSSSSGSTAFLGWVRARVADPAGWSAEAGAYARLVARQRWRARQAVLVAARSFVALERLKHDHLQLSRDLTTDVLTGLANRRAFEGWLAQVPDRGAHAALLLVDLDGFKQVNDTHGHGAGDDVLREVGRLIGSLVRAGDLAARHGGDEFVVALQQADDVHTVALERAADLRRLVRDHDWQRVAPGLRVGVSIGVAVGALEEGTAALYRRADAALYAAKRTAGGVVLDRGAAAGGDRLPSAG